MGGYTGYGGEEGQTPLVPFPAPMPIPPSPVPVPSPRLQPTPQPQVQPQPQPQQNAGDCVSIGPSYYAATCAAAAANCETYSTICKRVLGSGGVPGPAPATVPCIAANDPIYSAACEALAANCEQYSFCTRASLTQTSASTSPSGSCVASLSSLYSDASIWEPWCASAWILGSCPAPMCRQTTSLLMTKWRRKQSFLGTALLQSAVNIEQARASTEL